MMKAARGRQRSAPEVWRSRLRLRATGLSTKGWGAGLSLGLSIYLFINKKKIPPIPLLGWPDWWLLPY